MLATYTQENGARLADAKGSQIMAVRNRRCIMISRHDFASSICASALPPKSAKAQYSPAINLVDRLRAMEEEAGGRFGTFIFSILVMDKT